jgi:hypothetical protein
MSFTALQTSSKAEQGNKPTTKETAKSLSQASQFELKSKWMATFELFLMGQDPSDSSPHFWDDLFLLKIYREFLLQQLCLKSSAELISHWRIWSNVTAHCVQALAEPDMRKRNALETLYLLIAGIVHHRFSNWESDITLILAGKEKGAFERFFSPLLGHLAILLQSEQEDVRRISIHIIMTLITANNSIEDNFIVPFVLEAGLAPIFSQIVLDPTTGITRRDALTVITLLSMVSEISVGKPVPASLASSIGESTEIGNSFAQLLRKCESGPFLKQSIMVLEHDMRVALRHRGSVPYLERNNGQSSFVSAISGWFLSYYSPLETALIDESELRNAQLSPSECFLSNPGLSFLVFHLLVQHNEFFLKSLFFPTTLDTDNAISRKLPNAVIPPALVDLLELSSFFLPSTEPKGLVYARLILTTLLIIVENTELCFLLHDDKLTTNVKFLGDKHRTDRVDRLLPSSALPLASFVIEACHIFLRYHIATDLFVGGELPWICEVYALCLDVLHRVICFQKKVHIRLQYPWKSLWTTLMNFLTSFCASILARTTDPILLERSILPVIRKVLDLFNIGITFGDHFLPTAGDYDDLYYEIIRCERQFRTIVSSINEIEARYHNVMESMSKAHEEVTEANSSDPTIDPNIALNSAPSSVSPSISLDSELFNIISILDYFSEKLGHFQVANPETQLSGPLVINMIKSNYENLRLRLQDDIDQYKKYEGSKVSEQKMLRRYAKVLVQDLKLKRYTEIEAAISQRVPTKLTLPSPSARVVNLK